LLLVSIVPCCRSEQRSLLDGASVRADGALGAPRIITREGKR